MAQPEQIAQRALEVAEAGRAGAAWLEAARDRLKLDAAALGHGFRRFARRAGRLHQAAGRPTAVAVFGASQAGKSYLVSSLAAPRKAPLIAVYGTERLDFLKDLNPEGGKESTGLVSRFTIRRAPAPPGAPVPLALLTQTDIVKILANTFLEDFQIADLSPPSADDIAALFRRLEAEAAPTARDGLTIDDVEELRDYFEHYFRGKELIRALGAAYWTLAADIIPRLPAERRAEAYAPLWNAIEPFTKLAAELTGALARIGFADVAYCDTQALRRDGGNLLDAATVLMLSRGSAGAVRVSTAGGAAAPLDRAVLTALIAEVTVPLDEKPWDFFEHTDLLDFPGARSRKEHDSVDKALAGEGGLGELFLRGKVAYLFQRYNAEQEIAAMLLCVGPSVQEVSTLPRMVTGWIHQTMGATPAARAQQRTSLFLVLTKFDMELDGKRGEDIASGQRWTNRLTASLQEPFGPFDWVTDWASGRGFDNTFWLRSSAVPFRAVYDYAADGSETLAAHGESFLDERFAAYRTNALVRAHVHDPEAAWQAVLQPNDGGISYLASALRPVCDPLLKQQQIAGRIEELAGDIAAQLRPYHHSGDMAAELDRATLAARDVQRALYACAQAQMFGAFLRTLQVTTDQMLAVYWQVQSEPGEGLAPIGVAGTGGRLPWEEEDAPAAATPQAGPHDRFELLADRAIEEWGRGMTLSCDDATSLAALRLPREPATRLVVEIERTARRLGLRKSLADRLRLRAAFQNRGAAAAQLPVMLIEQTINSFVALLGYGETAPDQRPQVPRSERRIFAPRPPPAGLPKLGAVPTSYDETFYIDWIAAVRFVFEDNVRDSGTGNIDIAANAALGQILTRLERAVS
jgi:hypothetical protein